ncbi:uncharacterized protein MYCFIDRAFT_82133 [Pseudocercospora fijiensis CIRAD86]|uniref:Uncharacterized protein n=1 Tax=Pseudocercospora fijiensis (strain CIRAD86) TaxID=383855 RepID=M3BAC4_PSEFD|nr:uncharacterized protein MYCFIDRAFT_82133 [Pseudocercospora fijiensis CIRAD86]EME86203.1 hypothetical protein MYCFIDRAFT_82133 [Pseudocercospora fijiensis CIRAD86]
MWRLKLQALILLRVALRRVLAIGLRLGRIRRALRAVERDGRSRLAAADAVLRLRALLFLFLLLLRLLRRVLAWLYADVVRLRRLGWLTIHLGRQEAVIGAPCHGLPERLRL